MRDFPSLILHRAGAFWPTTVCGPGTWTAFPAAALAWQPGAAVVPELALDPEAAATPALAWDPEAAAAAAAATPALACGALSWPVLDAAVPVFSADWEKQSWVYI